MSATAPRRSTIGTAGFRHETKWRRVTGGDGRIDCTAPRMPSAERVARRGPGRDRSELFARIAPLNPPPAPPRRGATPAGGMCLAGVVELVALRRVATRPAAQRLPANRAVRASRSAAARGRVVAARQPLPLNRYYEGINTVGQFPSWEGSGVGWLPLDSWAVGCLEPVEVVFVRYLEGHPSPHSFVAEKGRRHSLEAALLILSLILRTARQVETALQ